MYVPHGRCGGRVCRMHWVRQVAMLVSEVLVFLTPWVNQCRPKVSDANHLYSKSLSNCLEVLSKETIFFSAIVRLSTCFFRRSRCPLKLSVLSNNAMIPFKAGVKVYESGFLAWGVVCLRKQNVLTIFLEILRLERTFRSFFVTF